VENGCKVSDHGLEYIMYENYTDNEVNEILKKKLNGNQLSETEQRKYKTAFMVAMGKEYAKKNLVMQLHYGVIRDLNKRIFNTLGADAGIDAVNNYSSSVETGRYLNALAEENLLPKTIIYPLNSSDFDAVGTIIGCFQDSDTIGKVQHGSGWWFNDNKTGMISQMTSLANLGLLGNFIGMLTDSRSFLSYTRHEYFRRIMCNLIGNLVENGEYPEDEKSLKKIVEGISYKNAKRYFGF
jgi:glucuronate isomerase